jgi:hypothetical protein
MPEQGNCSVIIKKEGKRKETAYCDDSLVSG